MQNDLIIINDYCTHCNIEPDFILMLGEDGLITRVRDKDCVKNRVKRAKIVRFTLC